MIEEIIKNIESVANLLSQYYAPLEAYLLTWMTADEWSGLRWVFFTIFAVTEYIKRYFLDHKMSKRARKFYIALIGLVAGLAMSFYKWPGASEVPWYVFGVLAGPLLNMLHLGVMSGLRVFKPEWAARLTGDKRRSNEGVPDGTKDRRGL